MIVRSAQLPRFYLGRSGRAKTDVVRPHPTFGSPKLRGFPHLKLSRPGDVSRKSLNWSQERPDLQVAVLQPVLCRQPRASLARFRPAIGDLSSHSKPWIFYIRLRRKHVPTAAPHTEQGAASSLARNLMVPNQPRQSHQGLCFCDDCRHSARRR